MKREIKNKFESTKLLLTSTCDFNKNMLNAMTQANTPKANLIIQSTKGPWADHMKSLMGGKLADLNQ